MRLTLLFVNAPKLETASAHDVFRTVFELPDEVATLPDFEQIITEWCGQIAEMTTVSFYVTCRALRWNMKLFREITRRELRRAVWNAAIFGFDQQNTTESLRGRYLKIPFSITPPFALFLFRGTRKRGSLRRAVRQPLTVFNEEQSEYMARVQSIAQTGITLLNTHPAQTWTYAGFHPDRFDVSLYKQYARNEDLMERLRLPEYAYVGEGSGSTQSTFTEYVYFIQQGDNGPIKIGYSAEPEKRLQTLSTASPYPLRILKTLKGGKALEQELHTRFANHQLEGEWFAPDDDLMDFISEIDD
ncbi:MAG: GIY-YIG nuclease family protein [Aggregatilineales bacterium]